MPDEGFLRRWARRKSEVRAGAEPAPAPIAPVADMRVTDVPVADMPAPGVPARADAAVAPAAVAAPAPTMDDVARLTRDSDFSAFVARGVDAAVRRTALKKLFADPHFNTMDRLDVYIDDYTKPSPVSEAMLASLAHAKQALRRAVDAVAAEPSADAADADADAAADAGRADDTNTTT